MRIAANLGMLFRELPLPARFEAARAAGFDGFELQFPYDHPAQELAAAAAACALPAVLINAPVVPGRYPMGFACRPEAMAEFRASLPACCEYARALGVRFVHVLAGTCAAGEHAACWAAYEANLQSAVAALAGHGIEILIEPLNGGDRPGYFLQSLEDAERMIRHCDRRIGLQFDAYHVARMGLDPAAEFTRHAASVRHVQVADVPGRHEPGTGAVDFGAFREALAAADYSGWVSAEYQPGGATSAGLGWLSAWRETPR